MAVWLDDATKNIPAEADAGQDDQSNVWEVPLHPGHAGATQYSGRVSWVLPQRISGIIKNNCSSQEACVCVCVCVVCVHFTYGCLYFFVYSYLTVSEISTFKNFCFCRFSKVTSLLWTLSPIVTVQKKQTVKRLN